MSDNIPDNVPTIETADDQPTTSEGSATTASTPKNKAARVEPAPYAFTDADHELVERLGPNDQDGLSRRQIDVWQVCYLLQRDLGRSPRQNELSAALNMTSAQGCRAHFAKIADAGFMRNEGRNWIATARGEVAKKEATVSAPADDSAPEEAPAASAAIASPTDVFSPSGSDTSVF
jgi:hypothetical protein